MEYYDPIDHSPKRYAAVITIVVLALLSLIVSYITIDIEPYEDHLTYVEIEYVEQEAEEQPQPEPQPAKVDMPKIENPKPQPTQAYENEAKDNTRNQTSGQEEKMQTVNQQALFKPTSGVQPDEEVVHGNKLAPEGESESHKGEGTGLNVIGDVNFDGGLQGRGVVAGYPRPSGNNAQGKVVVAVVVDSEGNVIEAYVRAQGTTTSDATLRQNAVKAAKRTKFKPDASRMTQSGTITYNYKIRG